MLTAAQLGALAFPAVPQLSTQVEMKDIGCREQVARVNETPAQEREFTKEEEEGEKGEARQGNHYC